MNSLTGSRLKGGILPLVLVISLIMASLCSALLLLAYYHLHYSRTLSIKSKLQRNLSSAIQIGLAAPEQTILNEWQWFDLYDDGADSVGLYRSYWGVYELVQAKAVQGPRLLSCAVMLGTKPAPDAPALYLADHRRSVSIAGNARIKGSAYLPEAGIKVGYIGRSGYSGAQLVYGKTYKSGPGLPSMDESYLESLNQLLSTAAGLPIDSLDVHQTLSFNSPQAAVFHSTSAVRLTHKNRLKGKIAVVSASHIIVEREAQLEGVVLIAPHIQFEKGFKGALQAFATDSLQVGEEVLLSYPSAVGLIHKKKKGLMEIHPGARIEGIAFLLSEATGEGANLMRLHERSSVMGQVYVQGFAQHEGSIEGSLLAQRLFLKTPSSVYENFLYNGVIDVENLSDAFVGSSMISAKGKRKIIAWLD
jgi:hypothetical protein